MIRLGTYEDDRPHVRRPGATLAWVTPSDIDAETIGELQRQLRYEQRQNRKLQCKVNRYNKLIPGRTRVWELNRIAMELEAEASNVRETGGLNVISEGLEDDALFIRRLEYDLTTLNNEKNEPKGGNNPKYDPRQWPRGERP